VEEAEAGYPFCYTDAVPLGLKRSDPVKVFIADDSALMRERLIAMLAELPGIDVVGQAEDGLEALARIPTCQPDVVILDIRMPQKNGIEVLEQIKAAPSPPVVIILTNYPYPPYRDKCFKAGADFFFYKAQEIDQLMQVLTTLAQPMGPT
jgi:DNA-binding NarL/FixJ family response regulator